MIAIIIFIYGLCFGSLYGVIIYRMPNNRSLFGRSYCHVCKTNLKTIDLIPILSFIIRKGKCKYCNTQIPNSNFIIELATGLLFLLAYFIFGLTLGLLNAICLWSMLLITGIIDAKYKIIIDTILIIFTIPSLIIIFIFTKNLLNNLYGGIIGFLIYSSIYLVSKTIYKKEAFGFGDVLFITAICLNFGTKNIFLILFLPFYLCATYIIITLLKNKKRNFKEEIPLGPFISISTFLISIGHSILNLNFNIFLN